MVTYARVGLSRFYVPAAFASSIALARIGFVLGKQQPDLGSECDVLQHVSRGTFVVFPTVTDDVASALPDSVAREIDASTPAGRHAQIAFLTATGGLRFSERVMAQRGGRRHRQPTAKRRQPERNQRYKLADRNSPGRDSSCWRKGRRDRPERDGYTTGRLFANGARAPISGAQRQIELVVEGVARGTLRFALEMNDDLLERFGVGPRFFSQEAVEEDTLRAGSSCFPCIASEIRPRSSPVRSTSQHHTTMSHWPMLLDMRHQQPGCHEAFFCHPLSRCAQPCMPCTAPRCT